MADEKRNWLGPYIPEGSVVREVIQQVKLVYHLLIDPRVHPLSKLIPVAAVAYLLFPFDPLPDVLIGLGQLDDLAILMLGFRFFLELAPPGVVHEHLKRLTQASQWTPADEPRPAGGDVVEGQFRAEDDPQP